MNAKARRSGPWLAALLGLGVSLQASAADLSALRQLFHLRGDPASTIAVPPSDLQPAQAAADASVPEPQLRVPHRVQDGPTCGLYALGMVMDYYYGENPKNLTAYVVAADASRPDADTVPPNSPKLLFQTAKDDGYFKESERIVHEDGGMYVADQLGQLSEKFGYGYKLIDNASASDIRAAIDRKHPALVAFDVDMSGEAPIRAHGDRAHWGVVVGYYSKGGVDWFIVQHGWTTQEYHFKAADLETSMDQIQPLLRDKVVEVFPGSRGATGLN